MTKNLLEINHFGAYLEMLAESIGYLTAKSFSDALNSQRSRRDGTEIVSERTVQRWMGDMPSVPDEAVFKSVCLFLERRGVLVRESDNEVYAHLLKLWKKARKRVSHSRVNSIYNATKIADRITIKHDHLHLILNAADHCAVADIISQSPHDRNTTYIVSELMSISLPFDRGALAEKLGTVILECGSSPTERKISAICANALARVVNWHPSAKMVNQLEVYFNEKLTLDPLEFGIILSPLAFALAKMGNHEVMRCIIGLLLNNKDFGDFDFQVMCGYYGDDLNQILAICSHHEEKRRTGIMMAHDTNRLLRLKDRTDGRLRTIVTDLLRQSGAALLVGGLPKQGKDILKLCNSP